LPEKHQAESACVATLAIDDPANLHIRHEKGAVMPHRTTGRGPRRTLRLLRAFVLAAGIGGASSGGAAERSLNEFWPEVNAFVQLDPNWRVFVLGTLGRAMETGLSTEGTFGVHLDYLGAPLPQRLLAAVPTMDRYWGLSFRVGYNRVLVWNPTGPNEDRVVLEATLRSQPLWQQVQFANRSRVDLRRIGSDDSWRYRNAHESSAPGRWATKGLSAGSPAGGP
jgi:hypothetical protein